MKSTDDWDAEQDALYSLRMQAELEKKRLDQIIMSTNPHSQEALNAVAALARADKAFRRADATWRNFINERRKRDPQWQAPDQ